MIIAELTTSATKINILKAPKMANAQVPEIWSFAPMIFLEFRERITRMANKSLPNDIRSEVYGEYIKTRNLFCTGSTLSIVI